MRFYRIIFSLLLALTVISAGAPTVHAADKDASISERIDEFRRKTKCDSVSVVVIDGSEATIIGDADALYQIGSMTKAFTGLAIQKLISKGVLSEDDRISEVLPGFMAHYNGDPCEITIAQLLAQTSGYTNKESDYPSAAADMSLMEWVDSISGRGLSSYPGEKYAYSNVNYDLLGAVIEQVTGKTYAEYMSEEILIPLGLSNTYAGPPTDSADIVSGSRPGYRLSFRYDIPVITGRIPAGYFYSNVQDMARWMQIWAGATDVPEGYEELVDMVRSRLNEVGDYYSGWELFDNGVVGHSGGTPNYSSRMVFSDTKHIGVCVLTNMNVAASTDSLCNSIYALVAGEAAVGLATDVWTIFDIIFSAVSVAGILLLILAICMKKRRILIITGIIALLLLASICIVMPLIFGAGLTEIAFIWAPYSFAGGLVILAIDVIAIVIKLMSANRKRS